MDEMVCTNLKQWKVDKKKSSGRYIGFPIKNGDGPKRPFIVKYCTKKIGATRYLVNHKTLTFLINIFNTIS